MGAREQWIALRETVTDIASRHLPQMEPDSFDHCEPFISDLLQLCDAALLLYAPGNPDAPSLDEVFVLDSFRTKITYFDPSDETSFLNLRFNREVGKLNRAIDNIFATLPDDMRSSKAQGIRVSPLVSPAQIDDRLNEWKLQTERLSQAISGMSALEVPEFRFGNFQIFRNRLTASITIFNVNISGTVYVPWGLVKVAGKRMRESWDAILKDSFVKKAIMRASINEKTEDISLKITKLESEIEDEGTWRAASQLGGHKDVDDLIVEHVRAGKSPPLKYARQGRILNLSDSNLLTLDLIRDCSFITYLNLDQNTELDDFQVVELFTKLEFLRVADTLISDLSFIRSLRCLKSFDARGTEISDLTSFAHIESIESLNIRATKVKNLHPLRDMPRLRYLNISLLSNPGNLDSILALPNLQILDARDVQNVSEDLLSRLSGVKRINVSRCPMSSVEWVVKVSGLERLVAKDCPVIDWTPLRVSSLTEISLASNQRALAAEQLQGTAIRIKVLKGGDPGEL